MAEYLERDGLLRELRLWNLHKAEPDNFHYKELKAWLEALPAEDVQPVKHGRWVRDAAYVDETTGEPCLAWFCNQCGEPQMVGTNYCPNCGAKMDGE